MKSILVLVTFVILNGAQSYVISETKDTKNSSSILENQTSNFPLNVNKHEWLKTFTSDERGIYLDDVLYALKNQNWTAEEEPCFNQTLRVLQNLQNFTLWAVWQWDSISTEPQGLLYGNRYHLGNFDQCMEAPWNDAHPDLRNQYCLADIILERSDRAPRKRISEPFDPHQSVLDILEHRSLFMRPFNYITWGLCVPNSCQPQSVQRLLSILLTRSHLGAAGLRARIAINEPCQNVDKPREYDTLYYCFIGFVAFFVAIALICTYIRHKKKGSDSNSLSKEVLKAFCLKNNTKDIFKENKGGIEVFYGIRFLTMCLIVMDHQVGLANGGPISNGSQVDKIALSLTGLLISHNDLFVDTFFLLSGFLTATGVSRFKRFPNPFVLILKRYLRLVIAFAVVIFFTSAVYPFTGSGPLWNRAIAYDTDQCRKNWWVSLLMLSNYIDTENLCMLVTWYIPCDFHFFTVTVLLYWLYKTLPRLGIACAVGISIASIVTPGVITYIHQFPPIQVFAYEFITNPRSIPQFHLAYIKSHARYAPYLVGFFSGLLFAYYKAKGNINRIPLKYSVLGTCSGMVIMLATMICGAMFSRHEPGLVASAIYSAIERPLWASSAILLVFCCSMGHIPLIKSFLSWYPWVPLSRLTYGLYLTHALIITRNIYNNRLSQHADILFYLIEAAGVIVWGCLASFIILVVFELPITNLTDLCLKPKRKIDQRREVERFTSSYNNEFDNDADKSVYMQDNLPSPSNIISKI